MHNRKMLICLIVCFGFLVAFSSTGTTPALAQLSDETREQKESADEDYREDLEAQRKVAETPKTAEEVLELLKQRAKAKIWKERKKELFKTAATWDAVYEHETNPASNNLQKGDGSYESNFNFDWKPTFTKKLSGTGTYSFIDTNYNEQEALGTSNHTVKAKLKYYPFANRKLVLEPQGNYEWNIYPFDGGSSYEQSKAIVDLTHYTTKLWNLGGQYEYAYKIYDKKAARNILEQNLDFHRDDWRHSAELWAKRYLGKTSVKLRAKSFVNKSNDEFQKQNDYYSHRGYITISGSYLEGGKLYVNYTADYEAKRYFQRPGPGTGQNARWDTGIQHKISVNWTFNPRVQLKTAVTYKKNNANSASAVFKNVTYNMGLAFTLW